MAFESSPKQFEGAFLFLSRVSQFRGVCEREKTKGENKEMTLRKRREGELRERGENKRERRENLPSSTLLPLSPPSFLLPPSSFLLLLPPSSFLLPPSSFLLPPSSFLLPPSSFLPSFFLLPPSSSRKMNGVARFISDEVSKSWRDQVLVGLIPRQVFPTDNTWGRDLSGLPRPWICQRVRNK